MLRLWLLLLALTGGACVSTQPADELVELMSAEQLRAMIEADVILLGEQHDNPHHHGIQRQVLDLIGQRSELGSVVFEQAHWKQQPVLNALNNRSLGELKQNLKWESSGWPDYQLYEPVFMAATRYKAQMIAGNIAPETSKIIHQKGYDAVFTPDEQKKLGLDVSLEPEAQAALEQEIFEGHCRLLPKDHVRTMVPVQRARDAAMALAWHRLHKKNKTVFIVGAGHARKDFGIPWYLKRLKPGLKIYSIGMTETGAEPRSEAYDQIITTPPVEREDPCVGLKEKFSKPKS
ncbi:ChaN family lipoprotein [Oligoflexus tunisiensis]|uniref:ChaN family lipoprotein n=1 Tax=Oligoflexus tunisiensis TaxID=708132 RepID=UPI00159F134E|nr:ChaN family lipoprotein [Oligoflexus tunisiensis]